MAVTSALPALRAVGRDDTQAQFQQGDATRGRLALPPAPPEITGLAGFITDQWIMMRRHRDDTASGWSARLLRALRAFNGVYEPEIIEEIKKFGGSSVYARIVAQKCRGTTSLLRDVYIGPDRPWALEPPEDPEVPPEIIQAINQVIQQEIDQQVDAHLQGVHANRAHLAGVAAAHMFGAGSGQAPWQVDASIPSHQSGPPVAGPSGTLNPNIPNPTIGSGQPNGPLSASANGQSQNGAQQGIPPPPPNPVGAGIPPPMPPPPPPPLPDASAIRDRYRGLMEAARDAAKRNAAEQAEIAEDKIQQILEEGGFYTALQEFLVDLPLFPYAVIKGPTVRLKTQVRWISNRAIAIDIPMLTWSRVSPFDIYWTPGVSDIADANVVERTRLTRAEINDMLDLPGYIVSEVRAVLDEYGRGGLVDNWDQTDSERAILESRENPRFNQSGLIACLEFQGNAQGRHLLDIGMDAALVPDPLRDYYINAWLIGRHIVKVQPAPNPRKRHQYYVTSFEKIPGTPVGNGLPDLLADIQTVSNATLRALVNNLSISSGPQVTVNDDRLSDGENGEDMYPWKRWHVKADPFGNNQEPAVSFFMPSSNAADLLNVYTSFSQLADEASAIPRFMTGVPPVGGLGRTASGLSMLMQNSSKILQTVAANVDRDIMEGLLSHLMDMVLLTDQSGLLTGEEKIRVLGVNVAIQRETQRARQQEFLQMTGNPIDMQIMGPLGRAQILRNVAKTLGLPGEDIIPTDDQLKQQQAQAQALAQQQGMPGHAMAPGQPPTGGQGGPPISPQGGPPQGGPAAITPPQAAGPTGAPGNQGPQPRPAAGPRANLVNPNTPVRER